MSPVGLTSRWVAANRALESESADPLFADPYARPLAGETGFALLVESQKARSGAPTNGPDPYLSIRTRFFDDALLQAVTEGEIRQVVLLAAGMDARAFRLPWPEGVTLFEVDRAEVIDQKEAILDTLDARPRCARKTVRADLERDWIVPLRQSGFEEMRPAAFLVEGLLAYLEAGAVASLLSALQRVSWPGSWLGGDILGAEMLSSPYLKPFLERMEQLGCPWRFGTDEPEKLLIRYGWKAAIVVPGEPEANYGRWPYPVVPRSMPGIPRAYFATARRVEG
jgi:methyltransferase (TIGR00027 family)